MAFAFGCWACWNGEMRGMPRVSFSLNRRITVMKASSSEKESPRPFLYRKREDIYFRIFVLKTVIF